MKAPAAVVMLLVAIATALVAQPPSDRGDVSRGRQWLYDWCSEAVQVANVEI